MICPAKHTTYQPTEAEFKCPKCQASCTDSRGFIIDESAGDANPDCDKLHANDELRCFGCDYRTVGSKYAAAMAKKKNLVPCPHCAGTGMIKGEPAQPQGCRSCGTPTFGPLCAVCKGERS